MRLSVPIFFSLLVEFPIRGNSALCPVEFGVKADLGPKC